MLHIIKRGSSDSAQLDPVGNSRSEKILSTLEYDNPDIFMNSAQRRSVNILRQLYQWNESLET